MFVAGMMGRKSIYRKGENKMSAKQFGNPLAAGIEVIRSSWGWFLTLGILFILLGAVCVIGDVSATFATVLVFGWMLLFSGIFGLVHAFRTHSSPGFLLSLLSALFRGFTGYLLIRYPLAGAGSLTLILASFLIVSGLFRGLGAGMLKFPRWGWSVFSGIVSLGLGVMLLAQMPVSSVWFIGFAIGVDLIFDGTSLIGFATALRSLTGVALEGAV
jgi:uncharacterized membrane protein HdeD (DUF308 family)